MHGNDGDRKNSSRRSDVEHETLRPAGCWQACNFLEGSELSDSDPFVYGHDGTFGVSSFLGL